MAFVLSSATQDWPSLSGRFDEDRPSDDVDSHVFSVVRDAVLDLIRGGAVGAGTLDDTYDVDVDAGDADADTLTITLVKN